MSGDIVEGVFAIHKPQAITSAQVIRDVQSHFKDSALFAPWLSMEKERLREARSHNKYRSRKPRDNLNVKIGHGGTLDPLATGVLVLGVGSGTKKLTGFIGCTKSYDTVMIFGKSTDTYDILGKVIESKDYAHITKDQVEAALAKFRGSIMQRPPIYSALRVQGKHLYEYAREGKEVPVEIKERPVTTEELELIEWYPGGTHSFQWPAQEANDTEKEAAAAAADVLSNPNTGHSLKRAREEYDNLGADGSLKKPRVEQTSESVPSTAVQAEQREQLVETQQSEQTEQHVESIATAVDEEPCPAPACRLRMTVTSGFYVRSLCHDLGIAVGSLGTMAKLVRTRQGNYTLGQNVFEYSELEKGEAVWSPVIKKMLDSSRTNDDDDLDSGPDQVQVVGTLKDGE